nr:hypothetical protein [Tanacetum cinerariifolium]
MLLPHARGLGFKPRRGGFPSGAKKEWGLSPKAKVRVLHTAQLDVTQACDPVVGFMRQHMAFAEAARGGGEGGEAVEPASTARMSLMSLLEVDGSSYVEGDGDDVAEEVVTVVDENENEDENLARANVKQAHGR